MRESLPCHDEMLVELGRNPGPVVQHQPVARGLNRRVFLRGGAALVSGAAAVGSLQSLMVNSAYGAPPVQLNPGPYGAIAPVEDEATGLPLLQLPPCFRYISHGWTGDAMTDGNVTPPMHDGMDVIRSLGNVMILCRNHEAANGSAFVGGKIQYSPEAAGGNTNLLFNQKTGEFLRSFASLSGTIRNCAGGTTPWGTWLSCEETTGDTSKPHGYVFEVDALRHRTATPLVAMGRFSHEAVAVDPRTNYIYETEDANLCGFFRFKPNVPGLLQCGGRLQMARLTDNRTHITDTTAFTADGRVFDVEWVKVSQPDSLSPSCYQQGMANGGTTFRRLEGCWYGNGKIYIVATDGGPLATPNGARDGQVWEYDPDCQTMHVVYHVPDSTHCENPDNINVTPGGALLLQEDNAGSPSPNAGERLIGLTLEGEAFTFAQNNMDFSSAEFDGQPGVTGGVYQRSFHSPGNPLTFSGNNKQNEWAGACWSENGEWLLVNIQTPGITFAITGPWERGPFAKKRKKHKHHDHDDRDDRGRDRDDRDRDDRDRDRDDRD